ncbi:MAG: tetratricopeptide repeat protein [Planctomycetales bacterium]
MTTELHDDDLQQPMPTTGVNVPAVRERTRHGAGEKSQIVWRLNGRCLAWTMLVLVVLGPALFFWQKYQVKHTAQTLIERGRGLMEEKKWSAAHEALSRYMVLRRDDPEALLLRAEAVGNAAAGSKGLRELAIKEYFEAVNANPDEPKARLRLSELLLEARRFEEAAEHAETALNAAPDSVRGARVLTAALVQQLGSANRVKVRDVVEAYRKYLGRHPGDIELTQGVASMLQQNRRSMPTKDFDETLPAVTEMVNRMVEKNPDNPVALLTRYEHRYNNKLEGAAEDLERAYEAAPDDPNVLIAMAINPLQTDKRAAFEFAEQLLKVAPPTMARQAYGAVAQLYNRHGQSDDAILTLRKGLRRMNGDDLDLNRALLVLQLSKEDRVGAKATLRRIDQLAQRFAATLPFAYAQRLREDMEISRIHLQLLEGNAAEVLPDLKRFAAQVTEVGEVEALNAERERRWMLLAKAYAQVDLHDLAGSAYEELLRINPRNRQVRLLAAVEWRLAGNLDKAVGYYDSATVGELETPIAWVGIAECRLEQQLRRIDPLLRDWSKVEQALRRAETQLGTTAPLLVVLQATLSLAKGNAEEALAHLAKLADQEIGDASVLATMCTLYEQSGNSALADAVLDQLRNLGGNEDLLIMTEVELLRYRKQWTQAIRMLEKQVEDLREDSGPEGALSVSAEKSGPVLRRLITMEIETGALRSARRRLRDLRKGRVADFWVYETAADLAIMAADLTDLKVIENEVAELEGGAGALSKYLHAIRMLEVPTQDREGVVRDANKLVEEIETARPSWANKYLLKGRIEEYKGRNAEAIAFYDGALRAGARNLSGLQWLMGLLYRQNRFADAALIVRQFGQIATAAGDLSSLAIPATLRSGKIDEALRLARAAKELRPKDPLTLVWYAQTLTLAESFDEAEATLKVATETAPKDVRTWTALVWFYSRVKRIADAKRTLDELVNRVELSSYDRKLFLARGSDLLGDRQAAENHYMSAAQEHKKDARLHVEMGRFFFRFDHEKALESYRKALEIDSQNTEARRAVAVLWGIRGTDANYEEAMKLLLGDGAETSEIDDRRLQVAVLLTRGQTEENVKAANLAAELLRSQPNPALNDRILAARAFEAVGKGSEAEAQFQAILAERDDAIYLALATEYYLRNDLLEQADQTLKRLEEQTADNPRTIDLRVSWLIASERYPEVAALIQRYVENESGPGKLEKQKAAALRFAGGELTRARLLAEAEQCYEQLAELINNGFVVLALWLGENGRSNEGIRLCLDKMHDGDPLVANAQSESRIALMVLIRLMTMAASRQSSLDPDALAEVEALLDRVPSATGTQTDLLLELGILRVMQERSADAVTLYEKVLVEDPENFAALNNLSLSLMDFPERRRDALQSAEKAVAAFPNSPEMQDTKALVYMAMERYKEGREILERVCRLEPKNPQYRLHLAMVLKQLDELQSAQSHFDVAMKNGLPKALLTPAERRAVQGFLSGDAKTSSN